MTETSNLHLKKPAGEDFYNIEDFNANADIIDAAYKYLSDAQAQLDNDLNGKAPENHTHTPESIGAATAEQGDKADSAVQAIMIGDMEQSKAGGVVRLPAYPTSLPANGGNANTVNGHTVYSDVPENAKFTDTTYPAASTTTMGLVTTGTQEFGGTKYFANLFIKHGVDLGTAPSADSSKFVAFTGANGQVTTDFAHLVNVVRSTGINELHLTLRAPTSKKAKNMISAIISADDSAYAAAVISPSAPDWSALRNLASGSAAATTSNCPDGAWYGQYEEV